MSAVQGPTKRTDRGSSTFSMTVRLDRIPHCPICGSQLHGTVTRVRYSVAWCDHCATIESGTHVAHIAAMAVPDLNLSLTMQAGITFWVPDMPSWTSVASALTALKIDAWGLDPHYPQPNVVGADKIVIMELGRSYAERPTHRPDLLHAYPLMTDR